MRFDALRVLSLPLVAMLALAACDDDGTGPVQVAAPSGVEAVATGPTSVRVSWNAVTQADAYEVDRSAEGGAFATVATALTATTYDDSNLDEDTEYRYRVRAVRGSTPGANSAEVTVSTEGTGPRLRTLTEVSENLTLHSDTTYVLSGYVKVANGATLTIQPGTRIVGDTTVAGSSLWVLRGARIVAEGTREDPIVFTSQREPGNRRPGDWGGIVIVGNAQINRTANPIFTEGPSDVQENYAGGTDDTDDSGVLRFVRIEFAGYDVSNGSGQELNGLSQYAVGSGTTIEYVQTVAGLDDSFEWWGGTVDVRNLVSYESGDDHFDWTEGYSGRGQNLIALQTAQLTPRPGTGTVSSDPRGMEGDGCEADKAGCTFANQPYSQPVWANFTLIGPGEGVYSATDGSGAVIRRGSAGTLVNGIIGRWPGVGVSIRDQETGDLMAADSLTIRGLVLAENGSNFEPQADGRFGYLLEENTDAWGIQEATLASILPSLPTASTGPGEIDWRPSAGSAAATGGLDSFAGTAIEGRVQDFFGGTLEATGYAGAANPDGSDNWWEGWTTFVRD